ncbi:hypothetical protein JMJ58_05285 [Haloterrigena salifodinae]|uniref:Uncharacterized protein n=1 Tax=Haloterrigena salifodinae TaxID=2675099 RepID=A0A8T8E484_9EURY|nr:hypothetical protein [Haloterrigena salifodinae]QRV16306.1 hypothetical protein JMJ58_05285 [Haloterrigena salifodinae]
METSAGGVGFADDHRIDVTPGKSQAERLPELGKTIYDLSDEDSGAPHDVVEEAAADAETVEADIESLKRKSAVYEPSTGEHRATKRLREVSIDE